MKFIYVHREPRDLNSGVNQKISAQVRNLSNYGIDSTVHSINKNIQYDYITNNENRILIISIIEKILRIFRRLYYEYQINRNLKNLISSLDTKDIIYLRIPYPSPQFSMILQKARACKIIIEFQTIEPLEYRLKGKYWYLLIDFLFGDALRKYIDAIVGVTDEITEYEITRSGDPEKPHITLGNGIDVSSLPIRRISPTSNNGIHFLCVANVSRWHGLDRILNGIASYSGSQKVYLHIIGDGEELPNLQVLVKKLGISDNVIFHGFLTGEKLDIQFNSCHIAIGSLGLHRIGLTEASILKAREYCARGIPYLIACADPDFPEDFSYIHRISSDESPVDIEKIIEFTQMVCADLDHPQKMRAYALEHLDWSVKMKKLKSFMETLVDDSKPLT